MSTKCTPVRLAAELAELNTELDRTLARYGAPGTGLHQRARAAHRMAELYGKREALAVLASTAFRSGATRDLVEHLAVNAAQADANRAETWRSSAGRLETQAAELERTTAAAFNDGMNYVPGRGRVRGL
jgi:hypothetical protein